MKHDFSCKNQQGNNPKHTAHVFQKWFNDHHVKVLEWHSLRPDMIPQENMWQELKMWDMAQKPTNLTHIKAFAK